MTALAPLVLLIEDDSGIRGILRLLLESQDYRVAEADSAARGALEVRSRRPDLCLIDLSLPGADALEAIADIRRSSPLPILVLAARTAESQRIAAFAGGADDYVPKPFGAQLLLSRVRAALQRAERAVRGAQALRLGAVSVDLDSRRIERPGGTLTLTGPEARLLGCLARNAGMLVSQQRLIAEAFGPQAEADPRNLQSQIRRLREKLEPDSRQPRYVLTEVGVGYRLQLDDNGAQPPG